MIDFPIPLLGFAACSGTGKTTLLTQVIPLLNDKGIRIGVIKHSHHNIELDKPKKDSYKLRKAGAQQTILASPQRIAIIVERPQQEDASLEQALSHLQTGTLDLVLVEGFKSRNFAKIELHRKELNKPLLYPDDPDIIALATNNHSNPTDSPITQLDINDPEGIATFIEAFIRQRVN
jgi:molybdopterin-guanine dinucleotide biosynthesis protein MobB